MVKLSKTWRGLKHSAEVWISTLLQNFGTVVLFPGERSPQYLRDFVSELYLNQCRGILHVGANTNGEDSFYSSLGKRVIWVEGEPEVFKSLLRNIELHENRAAICTLLSAKSEISPFYIADNHRIPSSHHPIAKTNKR